MQEKHLSLERLKETALRASAVVIPERHLRRVIKRHRSILGLGLQVPHSDSYRLPREDWERLGSPEDVRTMPGGSDREIILLPEPDEVDLRWLWRRMFHERLHLAFDARRRDGGMTPARLRERLHRLGGAEFDEIRRVLRQDRLLLPPGDEAEVYGEFAARYLELRHFDEETLDRFFPSFGSRRQEIEALLKEDLDAAAILRDSRPSGFDEEANAPSVTLVYRSAAPVTPDPRLALDAAQERARGNAVGAAVRAIGACVSPEEDLSSLTRRTVRLLDDPDWAAALRPVVIASAGETSSPEAKLLYDLQAACLAAEATPHRVDLVEWMLSFGRRPIRRPLESLREVSALERLRRASNRLGAVRLPRPAREPLRRLLRRAQHEVEERIRRRLRPTLDAGIAASGLKIENAVERAAAVKLADELVDRVLDRGYFTFSELRDTIARNQAKLADLSGPREFLFGDALLKMDRRFAAPLEGVYRRGEVYLRWLQRFSAVSFGTSAGRFLTRFLVLPFGGAFVALEGLQHIVGPLVRLLAGVDVHLLNRISFLAVGLFLFGLLHVPAFRRGVGAGFRALAVALRAVLFDLPRAVLGSPPVRFLRETRAWRWFRTYVLVPALVTAPIAGPLFLLHVERRIPWELGAALFLSIDLLMNSPSGRRARELFGDWMSASWRQVSTALLPGILRGVVEFFRATMSLIDRGLYRVDEILRFRPGDSAFSIGLKAAVGLIWFVLTYFLRIYLNVLIEPQINPVKHFPVVTVAAKILLPMSKMLVVALHSQLMPLGRVVAGVLAPLTVFSLPGFFGFLVWELKENWKLYRASRGKTLQPAMVGSHGETVPRLLRPGFHSGTVPKLYAKLRRARRNERRVVAKLEAHLHHVEEAVHRFVERNALALLEPGHPLEPAAVHLSPSRIKVEIREGDRTYELIFEERAGMLVAGTADHGLLGELSPQKRAALEAAVAGLLQMAGADLSAAQLAALLENREFGVSEEGLVVWRDDSELVYPLDPRLDVLRPSRGSGPDLKAEDVFLARRPISWEAWVRAWEATPPPRLMGDFLV